MKEIWGSEYNHEKQLPRLFLKFILIINLILHKNPVNVKMFKVFLNSHLIE